MQNCDNFEVSSFIVNCYRHLLNGNNESVEKIGTEDLKIPRFSEDILISLCNSAIQSFKQDKKTLIYIPSPSVVIGDLHGNLHDLIRIMNSMIDIFSNRVLFLGDYVDRGQYQLETITVLLAYKIEYPDHFFLLRGNHEFADVNGYGGFKDEILESGYSESLYDKFNEAFSWFPISAIINDHIFCVHGGLSPLFHQISQIETEFQLPIKNIYTSATNPKKKHRKSDTSNLENDGVNVKSFPLNLNALLNSNAGQLNSITRMKRFSESSCLKQKTISIKSSLLNLKSPNNLRPATLRPKILHVTEEDLKTDQNAKLPPLATNSPFPKLNQANPSISGHFGTQNISLVNSNSHQSGFASQNLNLPLAANNKFNPISSSDNSFMPTRCTGDQEHCVPLAKNENISQIPPLQNSIHNIISPTAEEGQNLNNDDRNNIQLLTDLMWSDPTNSCDLFLPSNRGAGCYFGFVITNNFLKRNGMKMIVRGHESIKAGIESNHENKIVTIYSSSSLAICGIAACAIFDTDDNYKAYRLVPITIVNRREAKFFTPTMKNSNKNAPIKLNSFSRSQSSFYGLKQSRKNFKIANAQNNHDSLDTIEEDNR